jgi:hypothetical protein
MLFVAWGIPFAFWVLLGLGFLSWTMQADEPDVNELRSRSIEPSNLTPVDRDDFLAPSNAAAMWDDDDPRTVGDVQITTVESDWRRTRLGWIRLSHAKSIEPQPQNLAQRVSPLFWAVWLWLVSTWILVWSS